MNRFARFALVGILGTGFDFIVFSFALQAGTAPALARAFGYLAGTSWSFFLNRKWVFGYSAKGSRLSRFLAVYFFSGTTAVLVQYTLGIIATDDLTYSIYIAATLFAALINYFGLKHYVFKA